MSLQCKLEQGSAAAAAEEKFTQAGEIQRGQLARQLLVRASDKACTWI